MSKESSKPAINVMVALQCEAKPIIDALRLSRNTSAALPWFYGELAGSALHLIVTGIGQLNMATAVGWRAAQANSKNDVWLNIGSAGHAEFAVGSAVRIARCAAADSDRAHYPPLVAPWLLSDTSGVATKGLVGELLTCNAVCDEYPAQALVDMEGYAFFRAATRFSAAELVQSIKVISDNKSTHVESLNAQRLSELIDGQQAAIIEFAKRLAELSSASLVLGQELRLALPKLIKHLRCTVSQQQQLMQAVQGLLNLGEDRNKLMERIGSATDVKELLRSLRGQLATTPPNLAVAR